MKIIIQIIMRKTRIKVINQDNGLTLMIHIIMQKRRKYEFKKVIPWFSCCFSTFSLSGQADKYNAQEGTLRAGIAKVEITPDFPVMLYGYASRKTPSEGVHDPLFARVVVFENSGKKVVFVSSDLGSYGNDVYLTLKKSILDKFNLKESELFLSAIHSHSSPKLSYNKENGDPDNIRYTEILNQKLLTVIGEALNNLKPSPDRCRDRIFPGRLQQA